MICNLAKSFELLDSPASLVYRAASVGAKCLAFFPHDKRTWECPLPPTSQQVAEFKEACQKCNIAPRNIIVHGPYTLTPGSIDEETLKKTKTTMFAHFEYLHALGIRYYNIHAYEHGRKSMTNISEAPFSFRTHRQAQRE